MRFFISACLCMLLLQFSTSAAVGQVHTLSNEHVYPVATVTPLYEFSDVHYTSKAPNLISYRGDNSNFKSYRIGQVTPLPNMRMLPQSGRIHIYPTGTNVLPSESSASVRRSRGMMPFGEDGDDDDDFGSGGATDGNAGDVGNQSQESPIGSPIILALLALAYSIFLYRKKHQTHTIKQAMK